MQGRSLRREADPARRLQTDDRRVRRRMEAGRARDRTMVRIVVGLLAFALLIAAAPAVGVGEASARSAGCEYSHRAPHQVSGKHARHAVICLINEMRRRHGLHHLSSMRSLNESGKRHSSYMRRHACFSHQCPGEGNLVSRITATSYLPCGCTWFVGENIAEATSAGAAPTAIVKDWMRSPPHREMILSRSLDDVGVGVVWGRAGNPHADLGTYTADFGYRHG
jgi:uncharacterized protein YkwD